MSYSEDQKELVREQVVVRRPDIVAAKAHLLGAEGDEPGQRIDTECLIKSWVDSNGVKLDSPVPLNGSEEQIEAGLQSAGRALSLQLAGYQAIWELIHTGHFIPVRAPEVRVPKVRFIPTSERYKGDDSWKFEDLRYAYPERVLRPIESARPDLFTDGDLYLAELGIADLHPGIDEALREAARCFRYDLFTGAIAMLGAASEGTWMELGSALGQGFPNWSKVKKLDGKLQKAQTKLGPLMKEIREICEDGGQTDDVMTRAAVSKYELTAATEWADTVREARNVLHWGVEPARANDYDKVAVLMLSAARHLGTLWKIRAAALATAEKLEPEGA